MSLSGPRALAGLRVLVTRAKHQAEELAGPLRDLGADVLTVPLIGIAPPADPGALRRSVSQSYDWIVFTSSNAVEAFARHGVPSVPVAVVGSGTEESARRLGFQVALKPGEFSGDKLAEAFDEDLTGKRVLIPRAAAARDVLPVELARRGAQVHVVEAYRNVLPKGAAEDLRDALQSAPHWVLFASSSAVENFVKLTRPEQRRARFGSIGPITSAAMSSHGMNVAAEAEPHTIPGLVAALCEFESRT